MKNLHENALMQELSKEAKSATNGGYAPPSKEQMEEAREIYGLFADIICW